MKLIDTIEINYFRSIYRETISNLNHLNIFSGNNDVGKSNILKALNLFFNNQAEWQDAFDFYTDFSKERLEVVRKETIKGKQQIWIAITFNRPETYSGSLPEKFRVKKTWTRNAVQPSITDNLDTYDSKGELPTTLEISRRFLPQFLNRIHYEYIPAVKDKRYHQNLLQRLQKSLLNISTRSDTSISKVSEDLAEHIEEKILGLKEDFERATNLQSNINPPEELSSLFQSFYVSTNSEDMSIPLEYRGDGIQARFIPSVLKYIFENNSDYFIWGFEEPENSLEYSHAMELADDFLTKYTQKSQIFLTSHSPAFISIKHDRNNTYRVIKDENRSSLLEVHPNMETNSEREILNRELGVYEIADTIHENLSAKLNQIDNLKENLQKLETELAETEKPLIITEGKNDATILKTAWAKLYDGELPYKIDSCDPSSGFGENDSGGADTLRQMINTIHPKMDSKVIAIFDRDKKGIKEFENLTRQFNKWRSKDDVKMHQNGLAFAFLLPKIDSRKKYAENTNLEIEFLFDDEDLAKKDENGNGLYISEPPVFLQIGGKKIDNKQLSLGDLYDEEEVKSQRSIEDGKTVFAENIVPNLDDEAFKNFKSIFDLIEDLLSESDE